ncbi:unnamed protein product [Mycena citricolor]|uniref:Uncharacterized protein n=1 Tax=Mycena citricolor TaxID=2018698 RepID=A0AAD2Q0J9_9AGAR|nr:unnamed protein product [Mycena citricolor]
MAPVVPVRNGDSLRFEVDDSLAVRFLQPAPRRRLGRTHSAGLVSRTVQAAQSPSWDAFTVISLMMCSVRVELWAVYRE